MPGLNHTQEVAQESAALSLPSGFVGHPERSERCNTKHSLRAARGASSLLSDTHFRIYSDFF
jgi:hypothetical protein